MSPRLLILASFAAVYFIWGSTYLAIHYVVASVSPLWAMGARFVTAGLVLGLVARLRGAQLPTIAQWRGALLLGFLFFGLGNGGVAWAESRGLATGKAATLVAMVPLFIALLRSLEGHRPRPQTWIGLALGLIGTTSLARSSAGAGLDIASVVIVVGSLGWAAGSVLAARLDTAQDRWMSAASQMFVGGLALALGGLALGEPVPAWHEITGQAWAGWAYLVVFGSIVGFTAYRYLLAHVPAERVATYAYVNPVVALLLGAVVGELPDRSSAVGMLAILVGVALSVSPTIGLRHLRWRRPLAAGCSQR